MKNKIFCALLVSGILQAMAQKNQEATIQKQNILESIAQITKSPIHARLAPHLPVPELQQVIFDYLHGWKKTHTLIDHTGSVNSVAISPGSTYLASASHDATLKIWKFVDGDSWKVAQHIAIPDFADSHSDSESLAVVFSGNGKYVAAGFQNNQVQITKLDNTNKLDSDMGPWEYLCRTQVRGPHVRSIAFSSDSKYIITSGFSYLNNVDNSTELILVESGRTFTNFADVSSASFSPDGKYVAAGERILDNTTEAIKIYHIDKKTTWHKWQQIHRFAGHDWHDMSVAFSPDSNYVASGSKDKTIKIFQLLRATGTWQEKQALVGHTDIVNSVVFSPVGAYLASASKDRTIKIWQRDTTNMWKQIQSLNDHTDSVTSIAFSSDGNYLISGSADKTVKIWENPIIKLLHPLRKFDTIPQTEDEEGTCAIL